MQANYVVAMVNSAQLKFHRAAPVSPWLEMGAYEALWFDRGASFKTIADRFTQHTNSVPSDFVPQSKALEFATLANRIVKGFTSIPYGIRVHGAGEYPEKIRVAKHPVELLYYQGLWALTEQPAIAVVGSRSPSPEGIARARLITEALLENRIVPVSGLARGIDTVVHETAIRRKSPTIAVVGTPISVAYPKENSDLQAKISSENLLISQVPIIAYRDMPLTKTRTFFPERNVTMSALTDATIIVEAGETSGTLVQAKAALEQGKPLFILDSCFLRTDITWPARFESLGAIRVRNVDDILANVSAIYKN